MSFPAFTNKKGTQEKWAPFKQEWRGTNGEYFSNTETVRLGLSKKPETVFPPWNKTGGVVCFKQPSSYYRCVANRSNPMFEELVYWDNSQTSLRATVTGGMQNRHGNSPALYYMPGCMENPASDDPVMDFNTYNRLLVQCYLELQETKLSLGNSMAEAVSTVDMIADTAAKLAAALRSVKHGNWRLALKHLGLSGHREALKIPSSYYLQWLYGWKPLMSDIRAGVDLLKSQIPPLPLAHVRKSATTNPAWDFQVGGIDGTNTVKGKGVNRTKVELWVSMDPTSWNHTAHTLGLDNPLGILWEVTPWSFVVDWLIPVGDYLEALSAMAGLNLAGGYVGYMGQGSSTVKYASSNKKAKGSYPVTQIDRFGYRRVAFSTLPRPLPYVKSPFSTSHTTTALALLNQLFKGR
ncbi:maturation protein [ssRNA phage SRR7976301_3]|uniref:Maturation protein n=1 Tax=ssRNA phage SRR7976301_3 TaxID=2786664 RepID=A0A8S5L4S6_9VIRU|nr:maturation protein [ssRNA phage SRR7976301_3]DAD52696.1 TPA_asm: maturation protein [ssRNA phage SRR7976301_3]